jgi:membrane-associated phospholipid phosphatase
MLHDKTRSALLLAGVFAANFIETQAESWVQSEFFRDSDIGLRCAAAFQSLEGRAPFDFHNFTNLITVYTASIAYFVVFPLLVVCTAVALARRSNALYFRCFARAIAINYFASLPFYLFYPIPERWAFPESGALLLSDRVDTALIDIFRPISALDNCFPSSHVSITVVIVIAAYLFQMRAKHTVLALGVTVIISTYVLGIHWIPDMIAGTALGTFSLLSALAVEVSPSRTAVRFTGSKEVLPAG